MGQYSDQDWYKDLLKKFKEEYGNVPPPWVYSKDSHPYSIQWRMGAGETLMMVFYEWWESENMSLEDRVKYFKKWPPPPRWLAWIVEAIWSVELWGSDEEFDYDPFFKKLKKYGFEGTEDYLTDLEDKKWLEIYKNNS